MTSEAELAKINLDEIPSIGEEAVKSNDTEKSSVAASKLLDEASQRKSLPVAQTSTEGASDMRSIIKQDEESQSAGSSSQNQDPQNDTMDTTSDNEGHNQYDNRKTETQNRNIASNVAKPLYIILKAISPCVMPFYIIWMAIWPILSVMLGIILGVVMSFAITSIVFLLTFFRTPMHIGKMLLVTATTKECFEGHLSSIMRVAVFLCVPAVHVVFLIGITACSATIGTMYYIGKATQIVYKLEYTKTAKKIKSHLGEYIKNCEDYMADDSESHGTIYLLKGTIAMIPGVVVATFVSVPFSLAVVAITLYRLPINVTKTMKIALFTVVLKWDLRIVVLAMLPIVHILFPLVALFAALFGGFFWTWITVSENVFEGNNPIFNLHKLKTKLSEYHEKHREFVEVHCDFLDDPSGIPNGWDGISYGIEIERILRFQRDFVICCFLILLEIPVVLVCTAVIGAVKCIPLCITFWGTYFRENCTNTSCVALLGVWPFHVLVIPLLPAFVLLVMIAFSFFVTASLFCAIPNEYLCSDGIWFDRICNAVLVQFDCIVQYDNATAEDCHWKLLEGCNCRRVGSTGRNGRTPGQRDRDEPFREPSELYWDRFSSQCVSTTAELLQKGWISPQDVQELEPAIIQSIPAVAVLTILVDSIQDNTLKVGDIKWAVDRSVCKDVNRNLKDPISAHLWPMVENIQKLFHKKEKKLLAEDNIELLRAMLCANSEKDNEDVKRVLQGSGKEMLAINNQIRTNINRLVLAILRVKPYQERMDEIFSSKHLDLGVDDV